MFATVKNQSLYYQVVGKGTPLLLLHGWGTDSSNFWNLVEPLRDQFTLWLIDLPGFGKSDPPQSSWQVMDFAKLVAQFIRENDIKHPDVLGHSFGGRVAIKLASHYPDAVNRLILEDSAGIKPKKGVRSYFLYILAKFIKYLVPNIANLKVRLRHLLYSSIESDYETVDSLRETFLRTIDEDLRGDMKKITNQTLLIWGENDRVVSLADGKKIYQAVPNSRLEVIEGAGHSPHLDNPDRFVYYLKDFLL